MRNLEKMKDKNNIKKLTKEDIKKYKNHLTVGGLKEFIKKNGIQDGAKIMIQRVEDFYFERNDWGVYLKEGVTYHSAKKMNENLLKESKRREYGLEPEYDIEDPLSNIIEIGDELKEQYHPAWSCVKYKDDQDFLFIDLHY